MTGYIALGKYASATEEALHALCRADWAEESLGDNSDWIAYGWRISIHEHDGGDELDTILAEQDLTGHVSIEDLVGDWIVKEDSNGFIHVTRYESQTEFTAAWDEFEYRYGLFEDWDELEYDSEVTLIEDHMGGCDGKTLIPAGSMGRVGEGQDGNQYAVVFDDYTDSEGVTVTLWLRYDEVVD